MSGAAGAIGERRVAARLSEGAAGGRDRQPAAPRDGLAVDVLCGNGAAAAIADEWRRLEAIADTPVLFQSEAWCRTVLDAARKAGRAEAAAIVSARLCGRLVALLPLTVTRIGPLAIGRLLGEPLTQYAEMLVAPDEPDAASALIDGLRSALPIDALVVRRARRDSRLAHCLAAAGATLLPAGAAREAPLGGLGGIAAFGASVDTKAARERRRLRRRLDEAGLVEIAHLPPGAEAQAAVAAAIAWKRQWLSGRGSTSKAFAQPFWTNTIAALAGAAEPGALTTVVRLDGEPVAVELGFRHGGRHYCFLGASRPGMGRLSPAKAAMEAAVTRCLSDGVACYDLLGPDDTYKHEWCPAAMPLFDAALPLTGRGRAYVRIVEAWARPAARRVARHVPMPLRAMASRLLIRS